MSTPTPCDGCGTIEREVERSDFLGVTLCGRCYAARAAVNGSGPDGAADLLSESRVDLIQLIREGIPDREYILGGEPWLIRGKRYLTAAPAGVGKSLVALVAAVEIVARGGRVVIFDVEMGADEYARRLEDVLENRDDQVAEACRARLVYYEFPALRLDWTPQEWARSVAGADLMIFVLVSDGALQRRAERGRERRLRSLCQRADRAARPR
jgi:hypothetical protein